jgi:hypothetical protein
MDKGFSDRGTNTYERDEKKKEKFVFFRFLHEAVTKAFFYLDDSQ